MILIVDDDTDLAETCAMMLRISGYEVALANGCKSAMEMMHVRLPQMLISDCCMPDMTGLQLCDYLHEVHQVVPFPILLMSGSPQHLAAPGQGYDSFLRKPFLAEALLAQVRLLAGAPRALPVQAPTTIH